MSEYANIAFDITIGIFGAIGVIASMGCVGVSVAMTCKWLQETCTKARTKSVIPKSSKKDARVVMINGTIDVPMADTVRDQILSAEKDKITTLDVIINTKGGKWIAVYQILDALVRYQGSTRCWVPRVALSGGSIIACSLLHKGPVYAGRFSRFGPFDGVLNSVTLHEAKELELCKQSKLSEEYNISKTRLKQVSDRLLVIATRYFLPHVTAAQRNMVQSELIETRHSHNDTMFSEYVSRPALAICFACCNPRFQLRFKLFVDKTWSIWAYP
jgi:hypothetical protein